MTIIVLTFEAFFTSYLMGQKAWSPNTLISYQDTWRLLLTYSLRKAPLRAELAGFRGPRCSTHHGVPSRLGGLTRQQPVHPEHPAGGNSCVLPLRHLPTPRTCRSHQQGLGACTQEHGHERHRLPLRCRSQKH